jgi:hypothetical protein
VLGLLQRYLGKYVYGLDAESLRISVWRGDVELSNLRLKPEALDELNLPVTVKSGLLGRLRLKVRPERGGGTPPHNAATSAAARRQGPTGGVGAGSLHYCLQRSQRNNLMCQAAVPLTTLLHCTLCRCPGRSSAPSLLWQSLTGCTL